MDAKTKTRKVNALMTKYIQLYEDRYGVKPKFNRYTEKWGFENMLEDLGFEAMPTLEYYFTLARRVHTTSELLRGYPEFNEWRTQDIEDEENRRLLAIKTKERVEEHRKTWQQKPST